MSRKRQMVVAMLLGTLGLVGLVVAAVSAASNLAAARAWYAAEVKKLSDTSTVDDLIALAKGCYQRDLKDESMTHAIEAYKKAPDDVRPKYLIFALSGREMDDVIEPPPPPGKPPKLTITDAEAEVVYREEGEKVVTAFRQIQSLMVRRCASVKCHGGGNPKAQWALVLKGPVNRKTLAQNFRTVYKYMNRDEPKASTLLQKPLKGPEDGHPAQIIRGETDSMFKRIADYIDTVKTDAEKMWEK
jgi:hypothetical protein